MSEELSEETKEILREMGPVNRAPMRRWFAASPHFREFVAYIDFLDGPKEESNG